MRTRSWLAERRPVAAPRQAARRQTGHANVAATSEGERVFEAKRRARRRHTAAMLAHWSSADRNQFVMLLDRFNTDFESYRPIILDAAAKHAAPARQGGPTS